MVEPFGEGASAEVFKFSLFLVLCNRLTSCAVAVFGLVVSLGRGSGQGWATCCTGLSGISS